MYVATIKPRRPKRIASWRYQRDPYYDAEHYYYYDDRWLAVDRSSSLRSSRYTYSEVRGRNLKGMNPVWI